MRETEKRSTISNKDPVSLDLAPSGLREEGGVGKKRDRKREESWFSKNWTSMIVNCGRVYKECSSRSNESVFTFQQLTT